MDSRRRTTRPHIRVQRKKSVVFHAPGWKNSVSHVVREVLPESPSTDVDEESEENEETDDTYEDGETEESSSEDDEEQGGVVVDMDSELEDIRADADEAFNNGPIRLAPGYVEEAKYTMKKNAEDDTGAAVYVRVKEVADHSEEAIAELTPPASEDVEVPEHFKEKHDAIAVSEQPHVKDPENFEDDSLEPSLRLAFYGLGMDVAKTTFEPGLERVTVSRLDGTQPSAYISTKGAHEEFDHVVACRSSTSNITLSVYDNLEHGEDTHVFTSLQIPKKANASGKGTDEDSVALHKIIRGRMKNHVQSQNIVAVLGNLYYLHLLSKDVLPTLDRVVTMHFYDIPKDAVTPDEREELFLSRRQQLHHIIPQLSNCATLVLAFENIYMLKHSNLPSFFRRTPKRTGLKIEMRIGSIWSVPVEVPQTRIAREGINSTVFAKECRNILNGPHEFEKESYDAIEMIRCRLLEKLNGALGVGWVVPYGSRLDSTWMLTRMWKNEVWIWE